MTCRTEFCCKESLMTTAINQWTRVGARRYCQLSWSTTVQFLSVYLSRVKSITRFDDRYTDAKFSKFRVWNKVPEGNTLILEIPSVHWHCWLGGRKGIRPVKNWVVGAGVVICLEQGADLHMVQLIPLPLNVSCSSKIQIGLPFWYRLTRIVPDKGPLNVCVCVWRYPNFLLTQWRMGGMMLPCQNQLDSFSLFDCFDLWQTDRPRAVALA